MAVRKTDKLKEKKNDNIHLRCTTSEKKKLEMYAAKRNMSITDYLLTYAMEVAEENKKCDKKSIKTEDISLIASVSNTFWKVKNWKDTEGGQEELVAILEKGMKEAWSFIHVN